MLTVGDASPALTEIRCRFRDHGLTEVRRGLTFIYLAPAPGDERVFLVLNAVGRGAQIYLYPEALDRAPGWAQPFYTALEAADFGLGSKLGPSVSLEPDDPARMALFWSLFDALMATAAAGGRDG